MSPSRNTVFRSLANSLDRNRRRHFEQEPLRRAAAGDQQTGAFQSCARHHDARAHVEAAGHAIGFVGHFGADPERLAADANRVADVRIETQQYAVGNRDGIGLQGRPKIHRRIEFDRAVERIDRRIDRFDRNQQRRRAIRRRGHRQGLGDLRALDAAFREAGSFRPSADRSATETCAPSDRPP